MYWLVLMFDISNSKMLEIGQPARSGRVHLHPWLCLA